MVKSYEQVKVEGEAEGIRRIRERGVYLITGGMGGIGQMLGEYMAREARARMVMVGRSEFPAREEWERWKEEKGAEDEISKKIKRLERMEESGGEVEVMRADVSEEREMREVIRKTYERFGELNGVIHAAGLAGTKALKLIAEAQPADSELQFEAKVYGLYALEKAVRDLDLDFIVLFSSTASILGGIGSVSYCAANLFMDSFAASRGATNKSPWISANWDGWLLEGQDKLSQSFQTSLDQYAMRPEESLKAFTYVLSMTDANQVVISTGDINSRLKEWIGPAARRTNAGDRDAPSLYQRPALGTAYVAPSDEIEKVIVKVWQELLRIDRLGIHDNFFELGGNSLIGLSVISRLKKELNVDIPVVALFEGPTVSALAKVLAQTSNQSDSNEESRSRGERRRERRKRSQRVTESA